MGLGQRLRNLLRRPAVGPMPLELHAVPGEQLQRSLAAGRAAQAAVESLAAEGRTVIDVVMNGAPFAKWQMYPWPGGILDPRSRSQVMYHSHEDYAGEHGHFHTYVYHQRKLVHLVALGMDAGGRLNSLYTFNRWGPGDHYFPADLLKTLLPRFRIPAGNPLDPRLHAFVTRTLELFQLEIGRLFEERDAAFARYRETHGGASPFEDRSLEITSARPADLDAQVARLAAELQRRGLPLESPRDAAATGVVSAPPPIGAPPPQPAADAAQLRRSLQAGRAAQAIAEGLRRQGRNVVERLLNGRPREPWSLYPWVGGVNDPHTHSQYFFHSHPDAPEYGHIHVFFHHRKQLVHLVAIALDAQGEPTGLFTVNRWVTDDVFHPAETVQGLLPRFRIGGDAFEPEVGEYIRQLLLLFETEIGALLRERDGAFAAYRAGHGGRAPYEDRDLEVTSALDVTVPEQIARLEDALGLAAGGDAGGDDATAGTPPRE